jgi:NAD(P)-dependent dehydrogenase (short-subunit alcohol dehydrogenase family)
VGNSGPSSRVRRGRPGGGPVEFLSGKNYHPSEERRRALSRPYPLLSRLLAPRGSTDARALDRAVRGKIVLVTGASFGIGRALALRLGPAGAKLLLAARTASALATVAGEINAAGGEARAFTLDLADPASIDAFTAKLAEEGVVVDVVIHNAGKSIRRLIAEALDRAHDFSRTIAVNYLGPVRLQLALLPGMMAKRGGQIVAVSSLGVRLPPAPRWAAYGAAKSAFDVWLGSARSELAAYDIACTAIYLGLVHTRMSEPTESYRNLPGLTAEEAALIVCRALVRRPRRIEPWWVGPLRVLAPWCEGLVDRFFRRRLRRELAARTPRDRAP